MSTSITTSTMASIVDHSIRDGIYIAHVIYTYEQFLKFVAEESIKLDPQVQREEVKNHPGNAQKLLESLADSFPIGGATGYVNGPRAPTDQGRSLTNSAFIKNFVPTKTAPLLLTDFGHRKRWSIKIDNGHVKIGQHTLSQLKESDRETYDVIMESEVPLAVVFHTSGTVPRAYIARMFRSLQLSATAVVGERAKASDDEGLVSAGEALVSAISAPEIGRKVPESRGTGRAISHSLVIGAIHPDRMTMKAKDLERITAMSDADLIGSSAVINRYITALTSVKTELKTRAEESERLFKEAEEIMKAAAKGEAKTAAKVVVDERKKIKNAAAASQNRLKKCSLDLSLDGVLVRGCSMEPEVATGYIERFFRAASKDDASWASMMMAVTAHTTDARSFNADVWNTRWTMLKTLIGEVRTE